MSEIIKIIDERERQKKQKTKTVIHKGLAQVIVKVWELNDFVAHFS